MLTTDDTEGTDDTEHRTSNIEHRTSNIERRTSNIERRTPNAERRSGEAENSVFSAQHPVFVHLLPSSLRRSPNSGRTAAGPSVAESSAPTSSAAAEPLCPGPTRGRDATRFNGGHPSTSLSWGRERDAEPEVVVRVRRRIAVTVGRSAVGGVVVPTAAAVHAVRACGLHPICTMTARRNPVERACPT